MRRNCNQPATHRLRRRPFVHHCLVHKVEGGKTAHIMKKRGGNFSASQSFRPPQRAHHYGPLKLEKVRNELEMRDSAGFINQANARLKPEKLQLSWDPIERIKTKKSPNLTIKFNLPT